MRLKPLARLRNTELELLHFDQRIRVMLWVVMLCFALLLARLVYLQIIRHDDLLDQAESNRTAIIPTVPPRGMILDRNGVVLARNYSAYTLEITPNKVEDLARTIDELAQVIDIQPRDRRKFKRLMEESKNFDSLPIRTRLSDEEVARFTAQQYRFPGVEVKARLFRQYPFGELASHVVGYIGRINSRDKERLEESDEAGNYRGTQYIGKLGIEQSYEAQLHGTTGVQVVETSAGGRATRRLSSHSATPGQNLVLSLDIRLQQLVEDLFGQRRGALVALDPRSGEVLAFVSKPTFDPNLFVEGIDSESWKALNESIDKPLLNRALRGTYPPGSTYKPFMALGALEVGKRKPEQIIVDNGSWVYGGHTFRSHGDGGLGPVNMVRAIALSSNVYFYALANDMGVDTIHDFMKPLGFGQITGIDLPGEVRGVLPSTTWKRNTYKKPEQQRWYGGETISLGIGQGYNNFTMLQLATATAALANGGTQYTPRLLKSMQDPVTRQFTNAAPPEARELGYKPAHIDVVRSGLVGVVSEGTATHVFRGAGYQSAGKTGTAQAVTIGQKEHYNAAKLAERQRDHALYMAFAPAEDPKIVVAVVVENAGFGAASAAPIARRVFDYWLMNQYPSQADIEATRQGQSSVPLGTPRIASEVEIQHRAANSGK